MFVNYTRPVNPLESFDNSPFRFYLTGSRFFGNNGHNSDFDFFTEETTDVEEYLQKEGFRFIQPAETNYFGIDGIVKIYRLANVDVHLVNNAERKAKIQERLKKSERFMNASKSERKLMWSLALEFVGGIAD